jgi:hypothetical protein
VPGRNSHFTSLSADCDRPAMSISSHVQARRLTDGRGSLLGACTNGRYPEGMSSKESKSMGRRDMIVFQLCVA